MYKDLHNHMPLHFPLKTSDSATASTSSAMSAKQHAPIQPVSTPAA